MPAEDPKIRVGEGVQMNNRPFEENVFLLVKFWFSEKATKFEKIFVVLLTRASCSVRPTAYLSKS